MEYPHEEWPGNKFRSKIKKMDIKPLLSLFYECYRHGVEDASETCDENACMDYVKKMRATHLFVMLGQGFSLMWREWRIRMVLYAERMERNGRRKMQDFLMGIDNYGAYDSAALRIGMDFYVLGVEDFAKYPVHNNLELFFAERHYRRWRSGFEKDLHRDAKSLFNEMQVVVFDRIRYDMWVAAKEAGGYKQALTERTYTAFIEAVYFSLYKDKKKIKRIELNEKIKW